MTGDPGSHAWATLQTPALSVCGTWFRPAPGAVEAGAGRQRASGPCEASQMLSKHTGLIGSSDMVVIRLGRVSLSESPQSTGLSGQCHSCWQMQAIATRYKSFGSHRDLQHPTQHKRRQKLCSPWWQHATATQIDNPLSSCVQ